MEQLGPFHFFFTLSCAEKIWDEVKTSLLQLNGHEITFVTETDGDTKVYVDGVLLETYIDENKKEISDIYKDNFIYVARLFDDRLKAFKKHFLEKGDIAHYCYRIEFQARGEILD